MGPPMAHGTEKRHVQPIHVRRWILIQRPNHRLAPPLSPDNFFFPPGIAAPHSAKPRALSPRLAALPPALPTAVLSPRRTSLSIPSSPVIL